MGASSVLTDIRDATIQLHPKELWEMYTMMEPMYAAGLRRAAIVFAMPTNTANNTPALFDKDHELFEVQVFADKSDAYRWLMTVNVLQAS